MTGRASACSCCGSVDDIQLHHLFPKSQGCPDSLMVPLCYGCHRAAHGLTTSINHGDLVRRGLAAAKARGQQLGAYRDGVFVGRIGNAEDAANARAAARAKAARTAESLRPVVSDIDPDGALSLAALARRLNEERVPTPSGKGQWAATTVKRLRERLQGAACNLEVAL